MVACARDVGPRRANGAAGIIEQKRSLISDATSGVMSLVARRRRDIASS